MKEITPPPSHDTVGVCNQITLLILYYIISGMVTLLKVTTFNNVHTKDGF
jgi:hypothetical protein